MNKKQKDLIALIKSAELTKEEIDLVLIFLTALKVES